MIAWLVTNKASGSTSEDRCAAIETALAARGIALAGRSDFPDAQLPTAVDLAAAGADLLVLFAGDGTINATLGSLIDWPGRFLVLPGGTMNMLAKSLHGAADPGAIIAAIDPGAAPVALPLVEAGVHRAWVGLIIGPAASWFRVREALRSRDFGRLRRAAVLAWQRSFRNRVRIAGVPALRRGFQAIMVRPRADGIDLGAIEAADWRSISELGWTWLTGDWLAAGAVIHRVAAQCTLAGRRDVLALFDGEPQMLAPGTVISARVSRPMFIATAPQ